MDIRGWIIIKAYLLDQPLQKKAQHSILYLHGYNSFLSAGRREVLEQFGKVIAPSIDYIKFSRVEDIIQSHVSHISAEIYSIVGSSMGALAGYHVAEAFNLPCLLFNPAFVYNGFEVVPSAQYALTANRTKLAYIVLGKRDTIIRYKDSIKFIAKHVHEPKTVVTEQDMEHMIPNGIIKKHMELFLVAMAL